MFSTSYIIRFFPRKTLLVWGHIAIALIHAAVGLFNMHGMDYGVVAMVMAFFVAYSWTTGPIAWIYAAETVIDTGLGLCLLTLWATVLLLSIICPILMDPSSIGPTAVFFTFSGFSVLGTFYVVFFLKETKHLTDKEKKALFTPREYFNDQDKAQCRESQLE